MSGDDTYERDLGVTSARNGTSRLSAPAARRQLGATLRDLRTQAKLTLGDVATEIQRSAATVSRLERGSAIPRLVDVKALAEVLESHVPGIVTDETRQTLLNLARQSRREEWFNDYSDVLGSNLSSSELQRFVELETDASAFLSFESDLIPGLLQTRAYAAAVAELYLSNKTPHERERFVEFRLARQRVLEHLQLHVVVSEVALTRELGPAGVMAEQLAALADDLRDGRKNVSIQFAPVSLVVPGATRGPFVVMQFPGNDPDLVYLERGAGASYLHTKPDVERYTSDFDELAAKALDQEGSLGLLEEVIEKLG